MRASFSMHQVIDPRPVLTASSVRSNAFQDLHDLVAPLLKPLGMTGIVLIFTVFMLINREDLRNRLLRLVGLAHRASKKV